MCVCSDTGSSQRWCNHCPDGNCHSTPIPGHKYWQVGEECAKDHTCDCKMMLPADAFAICVWALVLASVLAPIGFSMTMDSRLKQKAKEDEQMKVTRRSSARELVHRLSRQMSQTDASRIDAP